jgi:hypothetical protein
MDPERVKAYNNAMMQCGHQMDYVHIQNQYADVIEWLRVENERVKKSCLNTNDTNEE